ncbi:MAG: M14 metallopeptidase family protein [Flavobacteriaceae bacterium]
MRIYYAVLLLIFSHAVYGQDLKSPAEFLGYELGSKFTPHHRVVDYCEHLAENANKLARLQYYGKTYEDRPLLLLYVSSEENLRSLESIRLEHLKSTNGGSGSGKAIVWLSYNVHGNESVSTEASMQTLYELLTSRQEYLENTVVILDPCINPDGRDRYVNWYRQVKNAPHQLDPLSREHHEGWHSGRSNHYMFDLNRDWAWLTQLESQQRIVEYNRWLPHIHVDFHEQGVDYPYFFAPAAEPFHEVITEFQREFQTIIGKNHAKYFDAKGWLYFTKERFDLFYPSYGDTYPTYNGAIGMTYEQGGGGKAGLGVLTSNGDTLTLKDRIDHHLTTGLSTIEVASKHYEKLNQEFASFFNSHRYKYKSYLLKGGEDQLRKLSSWLDKHSIEYGSGTGTTVKGYRYHTQRTESFRSDDQTLIVSTDQPKGTLVKVLFEPNAKLTDSLTYDITAWSLPYAHGLDALASETKVDSRIPVLKQTVVSDINPEAYAFFTDWNSMDDARFLTALLQEGIRVRSSREVFSTDNKTYLRGSLIITRKDNENRSDFVDILTEASKKYHKKLFPTQSGWIDNGKDLGSGQVKMIKKPRVAMLAGLPASTINFGEIWYFFEQELKYPLTILKSDRLETTLLPSFDIIILPHGSGYKEFMSEQLLDKLRKWTNEGGQLILVGGAIKGVAGKEGFKIKAREIKKDSAEIDLNPYRQTARDRLKEAVKGAIFRTWVDPTHPLAFGYENRYFTLKRRNGSYDLLQTGNVVAIRDRTTPVAGFSGSETPERLVNSLVFGVENIGQGRVVYFVDNPLFRGFWENGKLFFANALFMLN